MGPNSWYRNIFLSLDELCKDHNLENLDSYIFLFGKTIMTLFIKTMNAVYDTIDYFRRYNRAVSELKSLSDRDLADLGISRGEIEHVVVKSLNK
jgi:uncharacterized protein YjiS (DUF1127 family)